MTKLTLWQRIWYWHKADHVWESFHPVYYQHNVRKLRCKLCGTVYNEGVRGEEGQIIEYGFNSITGKVMFGGRDQWPK